MSGAAFSAAWRDLRGCLGDINEWAPQWSEPILRTFEACGYQCSVLSAEGDTDRAPEVYKANIVASIDQGLPVLAKGVMGPPTFGAVVGYDDYGDTLIGTNFFHNFLAHTPDSESPHLYAQRRADWNLELPTLALFGGRIAPPSWIDTYKTALEWAVTVSELERVPGDPDTYCGQRRDQTRCRRHARRHLVSGRRVVSDQR